MKNVEVGQKVVAVWGAMHPIEECVVEWIDEGGLWFKIVNEEGDGWIVNNIKEKPEVGMPVGVYFA
jgi:uncharacterized OB-fold protein